MDSNPRSEASNTSQIYEERPKLTGVDSGLSKGLPLPYFPDFIKPLLPLLLAYWIVAVLLSLYYLSGLPLVIAGWLSPTTIMLWPVGRRFGLRYTEYRKPWFIISVASMAGVPLTVGWLIYTSPLQQTMKYTGIITLIAIVIGLFGVVAGHRGAFGKPVRMFFRPDLILGPNRILAGGLASLAIGMKFMFTNSPPGDIPNGDWYAFFLIIVLGLYQIIPLRGLLKVRTMLSRILFDTKKGFGFTALKELYMVAVITLMLFFAHNFFGGVTPFTRNVLAGSMEGVTIMIISGALVIVLRALYKIHIGDPFIKETLKQSSIKDLILVIGMSIYFYGFINVMVDEFPRKFNTGQNIYLTIIGLSLYAWGVALLIPLRAWARQNQMYGIMQQMVHALLPSLDENSREKIMGKIISTVSEFQEERRIRFVGYMTKFLNEMEQSDREKVMKTQIRILSALPIEKRAAMIEAMDKVTLQS